MNSSRWKHAGFVVPWIGCGLTIGAALPASLKATEVVVHNFATVYPKGGSPRSNLTLDAAGDLYGTTYTGGVYGAGTVYRVTAAGGESVVYSFTGGVDGGNPEGGVIGDGKGNLYGTTYYGGGFNHGVVFKLNSSGQETVLYSFTGGADGGYPATGVIRDAQGNLFGTTTGGGNTCGLPSSCGVLFQLDAGNQESVLFSFSENNAFVPTSGLVRDAEGNFYGTAEGGLADEGCVYKVTAASQESLLYSFIGPFYNDGTGPAGTLILDAAGNAYGTTEYGGNFEYPCCGSVFEIASGGGEAQLFTFDGPNGDLPEGGVISDSQGNFYGTTYEGGASGFGAVFEVSAGGVETVLYSFTGGIDGSGPVAALVRDGAGNLYGTTESGGVGNGGVVFKVDSAGVETVLFSFPGAQGGSVPEAGVILDSAGNLYGTTSQGGADNAGTVYETDSSGKETLLYSFTGGLDGRDPVAGVIRDKNGNVYGTTFSGGLPNSCDFCGTLGVVYKVDSTGKETVLHGFTGTPSDGANPRSGLISDGAGNLYGTTSAGGANYQGTIYRIDSSGKETVLHSFDALDGESPYGGLARDAAGNLYGTAVLAGSAGGGTVFKLDASGKLTVLHNFAGQGDGLEPYAGVVLDAAGNLYGTTTQGGAGHFGVVYEVAVTGMETVLYSFTGGADGGTPYAGVIRDKAGNLYGTTQAGGANGKGVVYKLDKAGQETVLYSFTGADGEAPVAGLTFGSAANLYGTTPTGGKYSGGVIFEVKAGASAE